MGPVDNDEIQMTCFIKTNLLIFSLQVLNPCVDFDLDYDFSSAVKARAKKSDENTSSSKRKKLSAQAAFDNLYASEKDLFRRRNLPMVK